MPKEIYMAFLDKYRHELLKNAPVVYEGMTLHPLTVEDYDIYSAGKAPYELMLSSVKDPKAARLNWCACLWALDKRCEQQTGTVGDFLAVALYVFATALRLKPSYDGSFPLRPVFAENGDLTAVMLGDPRDAGLLNMQQMDCVRQIIAAQNGYTIPDENWNPELVRAAQENAARGAASLEWSMEDLVASVALNSGCRPADIYDWPIREFHQAQDAIDRKLGYLVCSAAELIGNVKFTKGNPYPSWKFNRKSEMPAGFRSISDIDAGAKGLVAGT